MSAQQLTELLAMGAQNPPPAFDDVPALRAYAQASWGQLPAIAGVTIQSVDVAGIPAELILPETADPARITLYLHGGGFYLCSPRTHRAITSRLAQATGAAVLVPDYRLAPEHPAPAAHEDALQAYRWLLEQGYAAEHIGIAGDSAGGNLALSTALTARDSGLPLPAALFLMSPLTDFAEQCPSHWQVEDPVMPLEMITLAKTFYYGATTQPELAQIATLHSDFQGLPPTLVHVGSWERLHDDSSWLVERLQAAGVKAELQVFAGMIHVWQIYAGMLDEGQESLEAGAAFLCQHSRKTTGEQ